MIDEQRPDEDRITHIDLLKRIQGMVGRIDGQKAEFVSQVHALRDYLSDIFDDKITENKNNMEKFKKSLDSDLSDFRKDIIKLNQEALAELTSRMEAAIGKIEKKFNILQTDVYSKIDDSVMEFSGSAKEGSINSRKELELVLNNAVSGMAAKVNDMRRYLDKRLSGLEESTLRTAQVEVDKQLKDVVSSAKDAQGALETYRNEANQAFTKYQAESMARMNELMATFRSVKEKFAIISDSLG